ncbi:hypothetical protein [Corynebacterium nuruki]|jgi:hypothetical protein|nr:hypothetical protein [Corynebacterium nuruki]
MSGNTSGWGQPDPGSPSNDETTMFPPVDAGSGQDPAAPGTSSPWQADAPAQSGAQGGAQDAGQAPAQNPWATPPQYRHQADGYGQQEPPQYQQNYQGYQGYQAPYPPQQQPQKSGGVGRVLAIVIPVLVVIALILALVWQWDNLFGSDDDNAPGGSGASTAQPAPGNGQGGDQGNGQGGDQPQGQARPTTANLPGGSVPANAAARNGEPTGQFNAVWVSPPNGTTYTSEEFGVAVRDAFVNDYLADPSRRVDRTVSATSPTNGQSYTMDCRDQGSYVHCTGGNSANVYIA